MIPNRGSGGKGRSRVQARDASAGDGSFRWGPWNKSAVVLFAAMVFLGSGKALASGGIEPASNDLVAQALVGTLYYDFDIWLPRFKDRIAELERQPQTLENRLQQMEYNFYLAGILAEFSHVLSFTSSFSVESIKNDFDRYCRISKELAENLLETPGLTDAQKAKAYFFLGASEGYMGIIEYGGGHYLSALINGLRADNHLEEALRLDPELTDAYLGLGIYRYGNTRLGGLVNFFMQGGKDMRLEGLNNIKRALNSNALARPLAMKILIWFYIAEEINPQNDGLPADDPLSFKQCRRRVLELLRRYEAAYFENAPPGFVGNKGLAMMKAIQFVLDRDYALARTEFQRVLTIIRRLRSAKGFQINPKLTDTVTEGIKFCDLMLASIRPAAANPRDSDCAKIKQQIAFIEGGGSMVEYESSKIRGEIQNVFYNRLKEVFAHNSC